MAFPKRHRRDQVPALYRWAAHHRGIFVNPALTEPFGLTLLEAAACGLPMVATDDGGPRDIHSRCNNGRLVDVTDPVDLQTTLEQALSDSDRWTRWSDNGLNSSAVTSAGMPMLTLSDFPAASTFDLYNTAALPASVGRARYQWSLVSSHAP